jgi:polar amino acid transport system substrate-binding protein
MATGRRPRLLAALACGLVLPLAACGGQGAAGAKFQPREPGVLKVATAFLPAPGFWQGRTVAAGGFEAGLAVALAHKLGLQRVEVVQVPFGSITSGKLGGADLALSQITPTSERSKVEDFSTPYLDAPPGILVRAGIRAPDEQTLRGLKWVVSTLSTLTPILMSRVRPIVPPVETTDRAQALRVLRAGGADALLLDLPVALGLAKANPHAFAVAGQLDGTEGLAAVLPKGSPNDEIVDSAIRSLQADGTIDSLAHRWFGTSQSDVPLIPTQTS